MERNEVTAETDENEKLIPQFPVIIFQSGSSSVLNVTWMYPSWISSFVAFGLSLISTGLVILVIHPIILPSQGPIWMMCLFFLVTWIVATGLYFNRLFQLYMGSVVVLFVIWCYIPAFAGSIALNWCTGTACAITAALSQHIWAHRFDKVSLASNGLGWVLRFTCMIMITWYTKYLIFGSLGSLRLLFASAPFLLQPTSVIGFGSLDFVVTLTNVVIGWWIFAGIQTRKLLPGTLSDLSSFPTLPGKLALIFTNPIVVLLVVWCLWVITAGIVTVAHVPDTSIPVATVYSSELKENPVDSIVQEFRGGARFVVTSADVFSENFCDTMTSLTCAEAIKSDLFPRIKEFEGYAIIGCASRIIRDGKCQRYSIAMIVHPNGDITPSQTLNKENNDFEYAIINPSDIEGLGPDKVRFAFVSDTFGVSDFRKVVFNYAPNLIFMSGDHNTYRDLVKPQYVVDAIENRVAIVRAAASTAALIVDPIGNIVACDEVFSESTPAGSRNGVIQRYRTRGEVTVSYPLSGAWIRQQIPYWIAILTYLTYLVYDIIFVIRKRRHDRNE